MKIHSFFILVCFSVTLGNSEAQIVPDSGHYVIALTHQKKPKERYIATGKKMTIWMGNEKVRGRITSIAPEDICIDSIAYSPREIDKIRTMLPGTTIAGALITTGGAGALALGGYLGTISILAISEAGGEVWAVFWGTLGLLLSVPIVATGVVLVPVGIIIICHGRTFDLETRWKLSVIPAPGTLQAH